MTTYYTPEEVAEILKVRKHTVWNWLREGTLKGTKINGKIWTARSTTDAQIAIGTRVTVVEIRGVKAIVKPNQL